MKNFSLLSLALAGVLASCASPPQAIERSSGNPALDGPSIKLSAEVVKPGLHIDLKFNGDIWLSEDGEKYRKVALSELKEQLSQVKEKGTFVVYTRESSDQDPPPGLMETFQVIASYGVPIRMLGAPE